MTAKIDTQKLTINSTVTDRYLGLLQELYARTKDGYATVNLTRLYDLCHTQRETVALENCGALRRRNTRVFAWALDREPDAALAQKLYQEMNRNRRRKYAQRERGNLPTGIVDGHQVEDRQPTLPFPDEPELASALEVLLKHCPLRLGGQLGPFHVSLKLDRWKARGSYQGKK